MKRIFQTLLLLSFLAPALSGCGSEEARSLLPQDMELRTGDVVLRRGNGMTSRAVLLADGGGSYSHVGLVADSAGSLVVVHAVPDEHDHAGDRDRVKADPPERFFAAERAGSGCVLRCTDTVAAQKAARTALRIYRSGVAFDHSYDESDTTAMYCCELVEFAYTRAGLPLVPGVRHDIDLPGLRLRSVILPSDFLRSKTLRRVAAF